MAKVCSDLSSNHVSRVDRGLQRTLPRDILKCTKPIDLNCSWDCCSEPLLINRDATISKSLFCAAEADCRQSVLDEARFSR